MRWLWDYFRRKTMESILAGVHDAFTSGDGTPLSEEQAAKAVLELLGGQDSGGNGPPPPPQLSGPAEAGQSAITAPAKRGPGRPRKFQEPPE